MPTFLAFAALAFAPGGETVEKRIYVIRHGEKSFDPYNENAYKVGCLSQMGWGRAYNLVSLFGPNPRSDLHKADYVFAAQYRPINCRDEHGWYRTHQTVSAVAQAVNKDKPCLKDANRCVDTSTSMNGDNSLMLKIAEHLKGVEHDDEEWDKQYCDVKVGTPECIPYNAAAHILKPGDKVADILWETGMCCNGAAGAPSAAPSPPVALPVPRPGPASTFGCSPGAASHLSAPRPYVYVHVPPQRRR